MSIVAWILLGIVAGVVANQLSGKRGVGLASDALWGVLGATVAGAVFDMFTGGGAGFSLMSLGVSLLGAGVFLTLSRAFVRASTVPDPGRTQRTKRGRR